MEEFGFPLRPTLCLCESMRVCVCYTLIGFWVLEGKRFSFSLSFFIHNSLTVTEGNVMRLLGLGAG